MITIELTSEQIRIVRKALGSLQSNILAQNSNYYTIGILRAMNDEDIDHINKIIDQLRKNSKEE